jgi:hypothetical protein
MVVGAAAASERPYVMPPRDPSQSSLDYETPVPKAGRVVTVPRWLYKVHRVLLDNVEVVSVVYGILLMIVGWALKMVGLAFVIKPKGPAA